MRDRDLVRAIEALADPERFRMIQELAAAGGLSREELARRLPIPLPSVWHHLGVLVTAGIVTSGGDLKRDVLLVNQDVLRTIACSIHDRLTPEPS